MNSKPKLTILVGPQGSGKTTLAKQLCEDNKMSRISQDEMGRILHFELFLEQIAEGQNLVIDRINHTKEQRNRYLSVAKAVGYETEIIVLHKPYQVCLERCIARQDHPTIKDEATARKALDMFFCKYERVQDDEADRVDRRGWNKSNPEVIYCDLDGTLCDTSWRQHHVQPPEGQKKNWPAFFAGIADDPVNWPIMTILNIMKNSADYDIVYCSGRNNKYREVTQTWLNKCYAPKGNLYMRQDNDSRADYIVKEILLDFEILTSYNVLFCLDDRDQVVKMLRGRGLTVLQVAEGNF